MQEKERIKELLKRVKDLEQVVESKDNLLKDYREIEKIADGNLLNFYVDLKRHQQIRSRRLILFMLTKSVH